MRAPAAGQAGSAGENVTPHPVAPFGATRPLPPGEVVPVRRAARAPGRSRRPSPGCRPRWRRAPAMSLVRAPEASTLAIAALEPVRRLAEAEGIAQRHRRTSRSSRSDWRGPCRRCRAPSRAPARRAPCACRSAGSSAPSEAEGSMPSEPVSIAATSDRMSPNRLSVTITSNCLGWRTSCMAQLSASTCSSSTSANSALWTRGDDLLPQHAGLHDVALLGRGHLVAALAGEVEGDAGDALDLAGRVDLRVDGALLAVLERHDLLRLAEIDAAGQLAHDHDVEALDDLALQRGGIGERRVADRRAQIGEQAEILAQAQQPGLGALRHRARRPISARRRRRTAPRRPACARAIAASVIATLWAS